MCVLKHGSVGNGDNLILTPMMINQKSDVRSFPI